MATKRSGVVSQDEQARLPAAEAEDGEVGLPGGGRPAEERDGARASTSTGRQAEEDAWWQRARKGEEPTRSGMVSASPGEEAEEAPSSAGLQAQGAQSDAVQASPGPVGAGRPQEHTGRWRGGPGVNFTPIYAKRHNCVRVSFKEDVPEEVTIDRLRFVQSVMIEILRVDPADLFCLIALPGGQVFDVSFKTSNLWQRFMTSFEEKAGKRPLSLLKLQLLSELDTNIVTVFLYNETLPDHDVEVWLRQHYLVLFDGKRVQDSLGIWTGARQWRVRLRTAEGALQYIPSALNIGGNRGYVVYAGQPKLCERVWGKQPFGRSV
ncbi:zinc finger CCHC domain-containing protein 3 [Lethenteron reissneri]|uniref:zinc finger CCHC domain-containing protein 3 n=1 Tax=Lethenteron reissneri TaxID=7753 RepID=UPI002AB7B513|nr:zinc finger CCHC domain-containing protein 3 [Lethenteron reissneri]